MNGTIAVSNNSALGSGTVTLGNVNISSTLLITNSTFRNTNITVQDGSTAGVIDVEAGQTFTFNGSLSTGAINTTKFGKAGLGIINFNGSSTYAGQLQVGNGTVIVSNNTGLGVNETTTARGIDLGLNVGDISQPNGVSLLATDGVTIKQSIYVAPNTSSAARTIGLHGTGSTNFSNEIYLDGTLTVSGAGSILISGRITNTGGIISTASSTILSNFNNNYSGTTTIQTGSELRLNPTQNATFGSQIILNGGILSTTNILTNHSFTSSSTLKLDASSTINLGDVAHTIRFASSNNIVWTSGQTLNIMGWRGSANNSGNRGKIYVGTSLNGLTPSQLNQIKINGVEVIQLSTGEIVPKYNYWIGNNGSWSNPLNWSSGEIPTSNEALIITNGTPVLDTNFTVENSGSLTINNTGALEIDSNASLTIQGSANFNGRPIIFKSEANGTASFGPLTGTLSGATNVTTQRYFPAKRAFRFTSSAVTTNTTIRENWQENVNNSNTTFTNNQNPNPGFGTHITGAGGSANGFDTTISNASSLFTFNNATALWTAVANTNVNTLNAGVPYRINVRGDRSIDMSLTSPTATPTTLRATGTLYTGTFAPSNLSSTAFAYNFIGNPYQAPVNMKTVLDNATNLNNLFYYVWDPTLNTRGAYVSVDLSTTNGTHNIGSANKFLQPGQACFVRTAATGGAPIMNFQESYKDLTASNNLVFKNANQSISTTSNIKMKLYDSNSLALNQTPLDGSIVFFDDSNNNGVDQNDAAKFANPDEMFSTFNNGALISIEKRMQPISSDIIPIRISQYRGTNYTIVAQGENLNGIPAYLHDQFLQTYTEIPQSGSVNYPYTVVTTNTQTTATDRFRIVYSNPLLNTANNEWKNFTLYPNPSKQGNFNIILGQPLENGKVTIYNTLGVKVYNQDLENTIENSITPNQSMPTGIYYVEIQNGNEKSIKKLIIE